MPIVLKIDDYILTFYSFNDLKSSMSKVKLIAISPQNWEPLRKWGEFGDSMNSIISKVLDKIDSMPKQELKIE